ncbi:MAG: hypothetical protein IKT43_00940 [Clostridia bacterium]|nr:hypothetical protein [Clostridia bacterium]
MNENKFDAAEEVKNAATPPLSEEERMTQDISTLRSLFPALTPEEIPDEVWEKVSGGESLAASYALYFLTQLKEKERIETLNRENEQKALPRIKNDQAGEEYYSPEAVKKMSAADVRKNYAAILKSMDSWN